MRDLQDRPTALERAFALADTGHFLSGSEIKLQLKSEGYSIAQITGPALLRQIRAICISAQNRKPSLKATASRKPESNATTG